jgi:predicted transcriptional regulator of viral defense system
VGKVQTNNHEELGSQKTLGPQAARLLAVLHEKRRTIFTVGDVQEVTGLGPKSTRNFVGKLVQRGVATRLKPGLFILVPFELGREREYLGNPYIVARALAGGGGYFLSHASAMDAHRMVTQPQLVVYVTSPLPLRGRTILGTEFRFVRCKPEHLFGAAEHWVDKTEKVLVSDLERTVIDGLKQPEYCGGIVEVAKGYWMRRGDMNIARLVDYALRLDVGAVIRRLGFLLETCGVDEPAALERLRARLTATYHLLDPTLPVEGHRVARWRLRLNVSPEELEAVRST